MRVPRAFVVGAETVDGRPARRGDRRGLRPACDARSSSTAARAVAAPAARRRSSRDEAERVRRTARRPGDRPCSCSPTPGSPAGRRSVDGRDAPIVRTDYLLRGVVIGPGRAHRRVRLRPWSWRIGWIVSLLHGARAGGRRAGGRAMSRLPRGARRRAHLPGARAARSSRRRCCPARRCRTPTCSGSRRRGPPSKPASLAAAGEPRARRRPATDAAVPARGQAQPARTSRCGTRGSPTGRPFAGRRAVGDLLAVQRARLRAGRCGARWRWIAALKLWVAAFGTFLLGRGARRCASAGRGAGGVVYGFSLWMVTWLSYPHASVWALIPWRCRGRARAAPAGRARRAAAAGAGVGAAVPVRAPGVELPRCSRRSCSARCASRGLGRGVAARARGVRRRPRLRRAAGRARAAAVRRAAVALGRPPAAGGHARRTPSAAEVRARRVPARLAARRPRRRSTFPARARVLRRGAAADAAPPPR